MTYSSAAERETFFTTSGQMTEAWEGRVRWNGEQVGTTKIYTAKASAARAAGKLRKQFERYAEYNGKRWEEVKKTKRDIKRREVTTRRRENTAYQQNGKRMMSLLRGVLKDKMASVATLQLIDKLIEDVEERMRRTPKGA